MKKLLPVVLSGLMAASFSQLAGAQNVGAGVGASADTKAGVDLNKAKPDRDDRAKRDRDDRATQDRDDRAKRDRDDQGSASAGASSADHDKDRDKDKDDQAKHENRGKHEGWKNNKHRDESSGRYEGSSSGSGK